MVDSDISVHKHLLHMGNNSIGVIMQKQIQKLLNWIAKHGVEIAIVIGILGILAAIILPELVRYYG